MINILFFIDEIKLQCWLNMIANDQGLHSIV